MTTFGNIDKLKRDRAVEGGEGTEIGFEGGITLVVLCASDANPAWKRYGDDFLAELRRLNRAHASEERVRRFLAEQYARLLVKDWRGVVDPQGHDLPFSRDLCVELLYETDDILPALQALVHDSKNFRGQRIEAVIEAAKN